MYIRFLFFNLCQFSSLSLATKFECVKVLQVKYFTGENITIYGSMLLCEIYVVVKATLN